MDLNLNFDDSMTNEIVLTKILSTIALININILWPAEEEYVWQKKKVVFVIIKIYS